MKTLFFIFPLITAFLLTFNKPVTDKKQEITVCHGALQEFGNMAIDPSYVALHGNQPGIHFISNAGGKMISYKTPDGKTATAFEIKAKKKSNKWLFVYQEWWGLNDQIKQEAEKYYQALNGEVNVLAPDMYDGKVTSKPEEAGQFMQAATKSPERLQAIIKGAIGYAGTKAKFASVGWCFGGSLSLSSAMAEGTQAAGCVMFYGFPEKDVEKLKTLKCDVLGLFGSKDGYINVPVVEEFQKNMETAGKKIEVKIYDAGHGFCNPSNPSYNKDATDDAFAKATTYLKDKLK
jgi:carboxymethylenebutenolidase